MRTGCAILAVLLLTVGPALAFSAEVMESVVSILPEWPSDEALPERPEGSGTVVLAGGYIATIASRPIHRASDITSSLHPHRPGEAIAMSFSRDAEGHDTTLRLAS